MYIHSSLRNGLPFFSVRAPPFVVRAFAQTAK